jgi:O-methyltransferase
MLNSLRAHVKTLMAPIIYRYPPLGLQPSELGIYLTELLSRASVPGDVAEVGCSVGGTACVASALVRKWSPEKSYTCFDTFGGFVPSQLEKDVAEGTPRKKADVYSANSINLVRKILNIHGANSVKLVQGDISEVSENALSPTYSVILLDVDLDEPTYSALKIFWPLLSPGGIILVDDCANDASQVWRARFGYSRFCEETGITPEFRYGFGIAEKPLA